MAVVRINQPLSFGNLDSYEGTITQFSSTQVTLTNGSSTAILGGQFAFDGINLTGTLQSINLSSAGQSVLEVSGLNYPADKLQDFIEAKDFEGALFDVLSGSDSITGSTGADTIFAGQGNDTVESGQGNDLVFGGQGDFADVLRLGQGADSAYGGEGADTLEGNADADFLGGGLGADSIDGGSGADSIFGGGDNSADRIRGGGDNDVIYAGGGNDTVGGSDGNDTIGGGAGADRIRGGAADDVIYLGRNDGAADVFLTGTDTTEGSGVGNGNDTVYAFVNGEDHIDVSDSGITQFSQLAIGSNTNGDAVVTVGANQTVTLVGIGAADLDASDFIFT